MPDKNDLSLQIVAEGVIRSLVENVGTRNFMTALHNAFNHGQCIADAGECVDDEDLTKMFKHFEKLVKLSQRVE